MQYEITVKMNHILSRQTNKQNTGKDAKVIKWVYIEVNHMVLSKRDKWTDKVESSLIKRVKRCYVYLDASLFESQFSW